MFWPLPQGGKTKELFTIINDKRVKCYSSFCGHKTLCSVSIHDGIVTQLCNYVCDTVNNDASYSTIGIKDYTINMVHVDHTHIAIMNVKGGLNIILILIDDCDFTVQNDTKYDIIEFVYQQRDKLSNGHSKDDMVLTYKSFIDMITASDILNIQVKYGKLISAWTGENIEIPEIDVSDTRFIY